MNYTEITEAAIAYADRYDEETSSNIPTFVSNAESRINRLLKTRNQSTRAFTDIVDGQEYYGLPPDWAGMRNIQLITPNLDTGGEKVTPISIVDPRVFEQKRASSSTERIYYYVSGCEIRIWPTQSSESRIELLYYQRVPPLTGGTSSNWLSEDHPDIYISAITAEISLFAKDYDASKGWFDRMNVSINELDNVDIEERWSGDSMQMKLG